MHFEITGKITDLELRNGVYQAVRPIEDNPGTRFLKKYWQQLTYTGLMMTGGILGSLFLNSDTKGVFVGALIGGMGYKRLLRVIKLAHDGKKVDRSQKIDLDQPRKYTVTPSPL